MSPTQTLKLSKQLSFGEEVANSVTHAVGAAIMLVLLPISAILQLSTLRNSRCNRNVHFCHQSLFDVFVINCLSCYDL